ncbi:MULTISPECIES: YqiJ family protein [unclassified Acinetobacter]|uniref:YqiJ family protein n=1 Tax=unclassified Acinetobacter TaxID=196816 RepID=UPI0015D1C0E3|nr:MULTISPECIES: YqiJ family protein [unclassified Acinetobacter]QOW50333.1 YqiJ family protein [Acinetobacter sp. YH12138]UIJ74924.1 YqiJ family protein [Acinetobacter sp. SH20PTE14]
MWELFTHPSNIVFSISLCLMFLFGLFEIVLTILGGGSQGFLDQFLPEDVGHNAELGVDADAGIVTRVLDWLYLGRIPLFVWLIIFLCVYSLLGFTIQAVVNQMTSMMFSAWIIAPACIFLCMPFVRFSAMLIARILPQDETTAIYSDELIGRTATIILGNARPQSPAQAKVKDQHGLTHYILVEPEQDEIFSQGQSVVLTQKTNVGFQATML